MATPKQKIQHSVTADDVARQRQNVETLSLNLNALKERQAYLATEIEAMERAFRLATKQNAEPPQAEKEKLGEMKAELAQIPTRTASLQAERLEAGWAALQVELRLATQDGAGLIHHPGYEQNISAACLVSPHFSFEDISGPFLAKAEAHAAFLEKTVTDFETRIDVVQKAIATCREQMHVISELDASLEKLRNQRRQAVACGDDTTSLDAAIADAGAACADKEQMKVRLADEAEGLNLRLAALSKALDAAQGGQDSPQSVIRLARQCALAVEYNKHAEKAAELFRQLFDSEDSVLSVAESMQVKGWQCGIPGIRHTPAPNSLYTACTIPRLRLYWSKKDAQEEEAFFYRSSDKLANAKREFLRKNNL